MLRLITTAFAAAFVLAATGLASAADMPRKAAGDPSNAYASASTWGGFYIGPSIGYAFGEIKSDLLAVKSSPDGFSGGGQVGINHQFGQIVTGIEADLLWTDIKDQLHGTGCGGGCAGIAGKYTMLGTFRARVGFLINPATLIYGTAGLAFGQHSLTTPGLTLSDKDFGWTAGGGIEYMLSAHWSARVQFLHMGFGDGTLAGAIPTKQSVNVATTGFNFKF